MTSASRRGRWTNSIREALSAREAVSLRGVAWLREVMSRRGVAERRRPGQRRRDHETSPDQRAVTWPEGSASCRESSGDVDLAGGGGPGADRGDGVSGESSAPASAPVPNSAAAPESTLAHGDNHDESCSGRSASVGRSAGVGFLQGRVGRVQDRVDGLGAKVGQVRVGQVRVGQIRVGRGRLLPDRLMLSADRLRSVASRLGHEFPSFAAALEQRAVSVQLMAEWFAEGQVPSAAAYRRLRVFGGREHPVRVPALVAAEVAAELRDIARSLRMDRRRLLAGKVRLLLPPAPATVAGPGSLGDVAWWCDDTADSLVPSVGGRRLHASSYAAGVCAGVLTPTAGWVAAWWALRIAGVVLAHPVTWAGLGAAWSSRAELRQRAALWGGWLGMSAPARFPVATDLTMRHTLAWWQGFSRGWNMAHQPWVWLKDRGMPVPNPPLMPALASTAELNAMLVTVGARWNRLADDFEVVVDPPVPVSGPGFGPRRLDLPSLVAMSDEIMAHADRHGDPLDDLPCAVRVAVLPGSPRRMVIILPGTQTFSTRPVRNPYAMSQNIHLLANGSASNSRAVQNVVWQARRRAGWSDRDALSIMVFGHSQGGIIAAELARQMVFSTVNHVTHVVTTGAPIAGRPFPAATSFLAVEHLEDVIPKLDLTDNPAQPNVVTVKAPALAPDEQGKVLDVHRWLVYERTLAQVAASDHPTLRAVNQQLAPYFEPFASLEDYPQHRPLPE